MKNTRYRFIAGALATLLLLPTVHAGSLDLTTASVADLNADGYEDVFVTAGMGYPLRYAVNSLLLNEGGQRFMDSELVLGVEPRKGNRIEKEFFTLDCSGEDKRHSL